MNRHLRRYRKNVHRAASRHRIEATVKGRLAVVATLDRLADIAEAAGDADAAAILDAAIGELCRVPPVRACGTPPDTRLLADIARAVAEHED